MFRALTMFVVAGFACLPATCASPDVFAFVTKSCGGCHNDKVKAGDLDLKSAETASTFSENREIRERVLEKLKTRQMPPPAAPQPLSATVTAVSGWLEAEFARQDSLIRPEAGRVTARRLNRAEYNNTVRDLLGVDIRPADNFPADTAAYGFDNNSDALTLSPALLEDYMEAAERVVHRDVWAGAAQTVGNPLFSAGTHQRYSREIFPA